MLAGPKSLGGPVALQLWRRDAGRAFDRLHFGNAPVYSEILDAWIIAEGRSLLIADDRAGARRWLTEAEINALQAKDAQANAQRAEADAQRAQADAQRARANAERAQADAQRAQASAERAEADAQRNRQLREDVERELEALKALLGRKS
jgi:hypothetical protein